MLETHDQYREIGIYGLECNAIFYVDPVYNKERQFRNPFIADIRNWYLLKLTFFYIALRIPSYIS